MSFKDIKGQSEAIAFLKSSIENNKIAHAYIFLGPGGIGKKMTALNFAKALNCSADVAKKPCDGCVSCKKIDGRNHPDVFLLKPEKEGASIGIDRIRALIRDIGLKPYEANKKVYIIDDADAMTQEASNALLKTLEEPPSGSVIILVTENTNLLLPTIVSRSQGVRFFSLGVDEVKNILMKDYKLDGRMAQVLSHISSGRLGSAIKYKDGDFFDKRSRIIKGLIDNTLFDSDFDGLSKGDLKLYLDIMLTWYRDVLVAKVGDTSPEALINIDEKDAVSDQARRLDFGHLDSIIKQIISTGLFLEQNANPKLAMSMLALTSLEAGEV